MHMHMCAARYGSPLKIIIINSLRRRTKMPFHCAVVSCRRTPSPGLHLYRFPSGPRGQAFAKITGLSNAADLSNAFDKLERVCSRHFSESMYLYDTCGKAIYQHGVPMFNYLQWTFSRQMSSSLVVIINY